MSEKNVEVVRRNTDAFNRGDFDGFMKDWAPDAVLDWSNSRGPDAGVYRGHGEVRAFAQRSGELFEEIRIELVDDPVEVKDGLVLAENVTHLRGRDGIEVQLEVPGWSRSGTASRPRSPSTRRSRKPSMPPGCRSSSVPLLWTRSGACMESTDWPFSDGRSVVNRDSTK